MSFATVEGVPCAEAVLTIPLTGAWTMDVRTASDAKDGDSVSCTMGDLALQGTVFRGGNFSGTGFLRVVGGRGGWRKELPARAYQNDFGLRLAEIVADAARECGEQLSAQAAGNTGKRWVRLRGPASRVLRILAPLWYVALDGTTDPRGRAGGAVSVPLNVLPEGTSLSKGVVECAPGTLAGVMPGMTFTAPTIAQRKTVNTVVHRTTPERIRTELWTS